MSLSTCLQGSASPSQLEDPASNLSTNSYTESSHPLPGSSLPFSLKDESSYTERTNSTICEFRELVDTLYPTEQPRLNDAPASTSGTSASTSSTLSPSDLYDPTPEDLEYAERPSTKCYERSVLTKFPYSSIPGQYIALVNNVDLNQFQVPFGFDLQTLRMFARHYDNITPNFHPFFEAHQKLRAEDKELLYLVTFGYSRPCPIPWGSKYTLVTHASTLYNDVYRHMHVTQESARLPDPYLLHATSTGNQPNAMSNLFIEHFLNKFNQAALPYWAATSIALSVFTLMTMDYQHQGVSVSIAGVTLALTNIVMALSQLIKPIDFSKILDVVPDLAEQHLAENRPNAFDPRRATKAVFTLIMLILNIAKKDAGTKIIEMAAMIKASDTIMKAADEWTELLCDDILGLDLHDDNAIQTAMTDLTREAHDMLATPARMFLIRPKKRHELHVLIKSIERIALRKLTQEQTRRFAPVRGHLNAAMFKLVELEKEVTSLFTEEKRVDPAVFVFDGAPNAGKTYAAQCILKEVAKRLGYNTSVYDLKVGNEKYYNVYGHEDLAFRDDFLNDTSSDTFVTDLTTIMSDSKFNLQGAFDKSQWANFKTIGITSNCMTQEPVKALSKVLKPHATKAMYSRFLMYRVMDPLGRGRYEDNSHRREDLSHLVIVRLEADTNVAHANDITFEEKGIMPVPDVIREITQATAKREGQFLQWKLANLPEVNHATEKEAILDRAMALREYLPPDLYNDLVEKANRPNQGELHYYIRLQGDPETGKTYLEHKFAELLATTQRIKHQEFHSFDDKIDEDAKVFAFNDKLSVYDNPSDYMRLLNKLPQHSIIVITSNEIIKPTKTWGSWFNKTIGRALISQVFEDAIIKLPRNDVHSGYMRRVGLRGVLTDGITTIKVTENEATTINTEIQGIYLIDGVEYGLDGVLNYLGERLNDFRARVNEIQIVNTIPPPLEEYDIDVSKPTLGDVREAFKSKANIMLSSLNGTVKVSRRLETHMNGRVDMSDWMTSVSENVSDKDLCIKLVARLRKYAPFATVRIATNDKVLVVVGPKMYETPSKNAVDLVIMGDTTEIHADEHVLEVPTADVFNYYHTRVLDSQIANCPLTVLAEVINYIDNKLLIHDAEIYALYMKHHPDPKTWSSIAKNFCRAAWRDHPVLTLGALILATVGSVLAIKAVYNWFTQHHGAPNNEKSKITQQTKSAVKQEVKKAQTTRKSYKGAGATILTSMRELGWKGDEHDIMNFLENTQSLSEPELDLAVHDLICGSRDYLGQNTPNSYTTIPYLDINETPVDVVARLVRKNTVRVETATGSCQGIGLRDNYFVTVAHAGTVGSELRVTNDFGEFSAIIVHRNERRDQAVVKVVSKTFPRFANIMKHIASRDEVNNASHGWYFRYGQENMTKVGAALRTYATEQHHVPLNMQLPYTPDENITFIQTIGYLANENHVFGTGDCGFPLILENRLNQGKLAGIHFCVNHKNKIGYFSHSTAEEFQEIIDALGVPNSGEIITFEADPITQKWLDQIVEPKTTFKKVKCFGFSPGTAFTSKYAPKKIRLEYSPPLPFPCDSENSITNASEYSAEVLADYAFDKMGKPILLSNQADKFGVDTSDVDMAAFSQATDIVSQAWLARYGAPRILNNHEALNHISEYFQESHGPDISKAAGLMYKWEFKCLDKTNILTASGQDPVYQFADTPAGRYALETAQWRFERGLEGVPTQLVIDDKPKVEILPIEKNRKGGTRMFNILPFDFNHLLARLFGHGIAARNHHRHGGYSQVGWDPIMESTYLRKLFDAVPGTPWWDDFRRYDKSLIAILIMAYFVHHGRHATHKRLTRKQILNLYIAVGMSYIHALHNLGGHVYYTDKGHHSGSRITSDLNAFCGEVANVYILVKWFFKLNSVFPTAVEVYEALFAVYFGDDGGNCYRHWASEITQEFRQQCFRELNLVHDDNNDPVFCSRNMTPDSDGTVYAALKLESLRRQFYWIPRKYTREMIHEICGNLIREFSLHSKEVYEAHMPIIMRFLEHFPNYSQGILLAEPILPYDFLREAWRRAIRHDDHAIIQITALNQPNDFNIHKRKHSLSLYCTNCGIRINKQQTNTTLCCNCINLPEIARTENKPNMSFNYKGAVLEWYSQHHIEYDGEEHYTKTGPDHMPTWIGFLVAPIQFPKFSTSHEGYVKKEVTQLMFKDFIEYIEGNNEPNMERASANPMEATPQPQARPTVNMLGNTNPNSGLDSIVPKITAQDVGAPPVIPNPIESTQSSNEQSSGTTVLNPTAPQNMLPIGGITFDTKDLAYSNALDTNVQYLFTDTTTAGSILFKIPYGHQSTYLNPYAKSWINAHDRYAGPIEYIIHLIGNATFSGELIIFWYPSDPGDSLPVYEMQKYAYCTLGAQFPSTESIILKDARQDLFYRRTNETYTDVPYIGIGVFISLVSPLKDGVMARLRIQSKLCNGSECGEPFQVANPILTAPTVTPNQVQMTSKTLADYMPWLDQPGPKTWMQTDGRRQNPRAGALTYNNQDVIQFYTQRPFDNWEDGISQFSTAINSAPGLGCTWVLNDAAGVKTWYVMTTDVMKGVLTTGDGNPFHDIAPAGATADAIDAALEIGQIGHPLVFKSMTEEVHLPTNFTLVNLEGQTVGTPVVCERIYHITTIEGNYRFYKFTCGDVYGDINVKIRGVGSDVTPLIRLGTGNAVYYHPDAYPMLPAGWTFLNITRELPTAVSNAVAPSNVSTNVPDYQFLHAIDRLAKSYGASDNTYLQFSLKDPETGFNVTTIRYHHVRRSMMVNVDPGYQYFLWEGDLGKLVITDIAVVQASMSLPLTDTSFWVSRQLGDLMFVNRTHEYFKRSLCVADNEPNIWGMLAGGALSGLGGALGQNSANKHELKKQGIEHEFLRERQGAQFGHEHEVREDTQQHQMGMQNIAHAHESALQAKAHTNKLTVAGASSRIRSGRV